MFVCVCVCVCVFVCVCVQVYFDDVQMQMIAKMLAEDFNARNPPKKAS